MEMYELQKQMIQHKKNNPKKSIDDENKDYLKRGFIWVGVGFFLLFISDIFIGITETIILLMALLSIVVGGGSNFAKEAKREN